MRGAADCLREWAVKYVRHRDIVAKMISLVSYTASGLRITRKDGTVSECLVAPSLKGLDAGSLRQAAMVVTLSNDENIDIVCRQWEALISNHDLILVFANPLSEADEKWVVKPSLHDRVCDRAPFARA